MRPIPYGRQDITAADIEAVVATLESDLLTQGPKIVELEQAFAAYVDAKYAVAVANGTAALHVSTLALNVSQGQKVITTPITFAASSNCVQYCGGEVVFADIDQHTFTIDFKKVSELLEASPQGTYAGVIPVDFTGFPVNLEKLRKLADQYDLWILEDACHSPGGYFTDSKGKKVLCGCGNYADLSVFSFHPVKHIAAGEGGMVTTNNYELYERLQLFRSHGITKNPSKLEENHGGWFHEMHELGYNYRLTDIQSALALSQLKRAEQGLKRRQIIADRYDEAFMSLGIVNQKRGLNFQNAFHLYVIEVEDRKELYDFLRSHYIYAQVHYIPTHLMPYYRKFGWKKGDLPIAERFYSRCLSLPMYPSLTDEEQEFVIKKVTSFLENR